MGLLPPRISAKIQVADSGCWLWTAGLSRDGYGRVRYGGRMRLAHDAVYEEIVHVVPEPLCLDHICRVRHCVFPGHLDEVTMRVNLLRGEGVSARAARRTHCPEGHALIEGNLVPAQLRRGHRECLICRNRRNRELFELVREAHTALGIGKMEYVRTYGQTAAVARSVIASSGRYPAPVMRTRREVPQ